MTQPPSHLGGIDLTPTRFKVGNVMFMRVRVVDHAREFDGQLAAVVQACDKEGNPIGGVYHVPFTELHHAAAAIAESRTWKR